MYRNILAQFSEDRLIITANRRLSRYLIAEHDAMHQGASSWPTLNCLPIQAWLNECWVKALASGQTTPLLLLNDEQEQVIWESIIQKTARPLLNLQSTVKQVRKGWQLLQTYGLSLQEPAFRYTEASQLFVEWSQAFIHHCDVNQLIDQSRLLATITSLIDNRQIKLPSTIHFMGFLDQPPALKNLINTLKSYCNVKLVDPIQHEQRGQTQQLGLSNTEHEIKTMVLWANRLLKQDANAKIACVVPDLTTLRRPLERIFSTIIDHTHYNISGGNALFDEPIIAMGLSLLKLPQQLDINTISHLLRSPFWGGYLKESQKRSLLDAKLREENYLSLNLKQFIKQSKQCHELHEILIKFTKHVQYQAQSPREWAKQFSLQLAALGWPGDRSLSSREHQAIQQWQQCLEKLASLASVSATLTFPQALQKLTQLARQQLFQIQTNDNASIQVLGLLEVLGLPFDHIWVMGLDDLHWPNAANPNPFLPISLQREHDMPHASAARELDFARDMQAVLQAQACQQLVLSYPKQSDDYDCLPSQLLSAFPTLDDPELHVVEQPPIAFESLETLIQDQAPPTQADEKIKGGSAIFKQQAACPFRAFAQFRLQAESIMQPSLGLTAAERGILVHQTLEMFWQQVRSHQQLCAMSPQLLTSTLRNLIKQAINDQIGSLELPKRILTTEETRLMELLDRWLLIEKSREPFTVVAEERWQSIIVGGIPLRLQIDRIDKLTDGSYIIIDYKTGLTSLTNWFGERPDDLQLPLYASANRKNLSGLYFAQIRADKMCFKGLSQVSEQLPGAKTLEELDESSEITWEDQLNAWQMVLTQLGDDFHAGVAEIDPKYGPATCQYCEYHSLCRINEQ